MTVLLGFSTGAGAATVGSGGKADVVGGTVCAEGADVARDSLFLSVIMASVVVSVAVAACTAGSRAGSVFGRSPTIGLTKAVARIAFFLFKAWAAFLAAFWVW